MKYTRFLLSASLTILLLITSCRPGENEEGTAPLFPCLPAERTLVGTFIRTSPAGFHAPATVTLTLANGRFSGSSATPNYPAICQGSYSLNGNQVVFTNECMFTADFDWTLILNGTYDISESEHQILFKKSMEGGVTDSYTFQKGIQ